MQTSRSSIRMPFGSSRVMTLHFRHKLSPYLGTDLKGRVLETWLQSVKIFWLY